MVQIAFLADRPDAIPTLARWFRGQWPDYYAARTQADVEGDFRRELNRASLPVRLVAVDEDGAVAGTVVLRERAIDGRPERGPGVGGLYVDGPRRGRGIGTELVRAATAAA